MDQDVAILSPEKTIITYRLAGLGSRILAHLLDILIIIAILVGISVGLMRLLGPILGDAAQGVMTFLAFIIPFGYFILFEGLWNGLTIGKKASGLRVRMADGTPITFGAAMGRNLLRPADMLPGTYLFGLLAIFTNPKSQRIGDLVANTIVCHERRTKPNFVAAPHNAGIHAYESHVGDLRGMSNEEYEALRRLADRFPQLGPEVQKRLIEEIWEPIQKRRSIPELSSVHPIYLIEAVVMKYGRQHGLL